GNGNDDVDDMSITSRGAALGTGWVVTGAAVDKKGHKETLKGSFGFEAKSKHWRRRDDCDANVNFQTRDVDFKAKSCDTFTLNGNSVVVKGVGRLERDRGTYAYVLSVVDAGGRRED